jgi:transcriptional regulator with XRE-family HTH domain
MAKELREIFAKNLKRFRQKAGFTQVELAEALGITVRYIQQLEGKRVPNVRLDTLAQIAKVLKLDPRQLIEHEKIN